MEKIITTKNDNYDMQMLMNIVGQSAMTTNQISQQIGIVVNSVNTMKVEINTIKEDMFQLKYNEEVTTTQQENIIEAARNRVSYILKATPHN